MLKEAQKRHPHLQLVSVKQVWRMYTQYEIMFPLRRGSDPLKLMIAHAIKHRLLIVKRGLLKHVDEVMLRQDLKESVALLKDVRKSGDELSAQELLDNAFYAQNPKVQALL